MAFDKTIWALVDNDSRLVLPLDLSSRYGLKPGARLRVESDASSLRLHQPTTHLAKIYLEPTNRCNIKCRTCMRNTWQEPLGLMSARIWKHILQGLRDLETKPLVMFAGIGEPLAHPRTIEMVAQAKEIGCRVELTTNGTLLGAKRSRQLVDVGLDTLWVSLDGATPESYADVRLGAELPKVLDNLKRFRPMRKGMYHPMPEVGIAFVAMKRNIDDLPKVIALGKSVGASRFLVSNLLPYSSEMRDQVLYERTLKDIAYFSSFWLPQLSLPKMDIDDQTRDSFFNALRSGCSVTFAGNRLSGANDACTFVESGAMAIGWDGAVSPCPPLLHNHVSFLRRRKRASRRHAVGNLADRSLLDLWNDKDYVAYRERVQSFAFPPCTFCGGCEMLDGNEQDCLGNGFPACGACLWAQGVIQCP